MPSYLIPKIGLRNIKTALAVSICILVSRLLHLEYPFYAVIAIIISMESSVSATFKAGKNRMIGTFIGALIAVLFSILAPNNILLIGLGIIVIIYICNRLKINSAISIGCIVFLAVMVNLKADTTPLYYATNRLLDTFLGILIAAIVNYFIFPPKFLKKISTKSSSIVNEVSLLVKNFARNESNIQLKKLSSDISDLQKFIKAYKDDSKLRKDEEIEIDIVTRILEDCKYIQTHLAIAIELNDRCTLNKDNEQALIDLGAVIESVEDKSEENSTSNDNLNPIFNYHISIVLDKLHEITKLSNRAF